MRLENSQDFTGYYAICNGLTCDEFGDKMTTKAGSLSTEKKYEEVYGDTFGRYSKEELREFVRFFETRFERNQIDPEKTFKGKVCLDAGCGNGRGALFMLMNGAKHVTCYDFSERNVQSTEKFLKDFGYSNFEVIQCSLEQVPAKDGVFDFVWCNGVVMHTKSPDVCLAEISRVLKMNGQMWLYIYGAGGLYWRIIFHFRELMKGIETQDCIKALHLMYHSNRYIAEFIDDWYASHLRCYTHADLCSRLASLGFENPTTLKLGVDYDSNHRKTVFKSEEEDVLMGEGDLRYLLTKTATPSASGFNPLKDGEYGSDYLWPEYIKQEIDPLFEGLAEKLRAKDWSKIALAAHIQRELRLRLTENKRMSLHDFKNFMAEIIQTAVEVRV